MRHPDLVDFMRPVEMYSLFQNTIDVAAKLRSGEMLQDNNMTWRFAFAFIYRLNFLSTHNRKLTHLNLGKQIAKLKQIESGQLNMTIDQWQEEAL